MSFADEIRENYIPPKDKAAIRKECAEILFSRCKAYSADPCFKAFPENDVLEPPNSKTLIFVILPSKIMDSILEIGR